MNHIAEDLRMDAVIITPRGSSFRHALKKALQAIPAQSGFDPLYIYEQLMERELRHPSAVGGGLSIPNLQSDEICTPRTVLALCDKIIDANAPDNVPVEMICIVLSPENAGPRHLRRLSRLSRFLASPETRTRLRETNDPQTALALMLEPGQLTLAA